MTAYAILDGAKVLRVVEQDVSPASPHQVLTTWEGIPPGGRPGLELQVVSGALAWVDVRTLSVAKAEKLAELRDAREAALNSTFTWDGSVFDADQVSQTRLMGLCLDAQLPGFTNQAWRLANNSWRVLNATDAAAVWVALKTHMTAQFSHFAAKETAVNAAGTDTLAKVAAIVW